MPYLTSLSLISLSLTSLSLTSFVSHQFVVTSDEPGKSAKFWRYKSICI
jgi:hypothetical protein